MDDGTRLYRRHGTRMTVGELEQCQRRHLLNGSTTFIGVDIQRIVDVFHFLSAGLVSFARGVNDTPKIVALLVAAKAGGISMTGAALGVGVAIAIGGILGARKVAGTMSGKIVTMNYGQGFTANIVTAFLVIVASRFGVPVSTTHVSVGSLFGLGAVNRNGRLNMIGGIFFAWVITLPVAALLAASVAFFV